MVTVNQAPVKERILYSIGGIAPEVDLRINNADINTLKTALLTRMYYCEVNGTYVEPPQPDRQVIFHRLHKFASKISRWHATPISLEEVVEMYKGRKQTIYSNALESIGERPVNRRDSISKCFVKCEKVNPRKAPRCIQPRDPRYNLEVGAYIKPIEHKIYHKIAQVYGDGPTVMKGYNVKEVAEIMTAKWQSFSNPVGVGLDAVKFDMHVSLPMLEWEHSIYDKIYNCSKLRKLLSWQRRNIGRGYCDDGSLKYKVAGRRFSGDMNTALGNCIIMCAMIHAYSEERNVHVKLMNNGDDCVVMMESHDLARWSEGLDQWFIDMGFRMTAEPPSYRLEQIEFCQMRCLQTINGPLMVRNIPTSLSKDCLSIVPLDSEDNMLKWFKAVGDCGIALNQGVPILQSYYTRLSDIGKIGNVKSTVQFRTGIHLMMEGLKLGEQTITEECRFQFWSTFGVLPDQQLSLEHEYSNMTITYSDDWCDSHDEYPHYNWNLASS